MSAVVKYIHNEVIHNLGDPAIIVPYLIEIINPNSVVDVGCGLGTFLHVFKKYGVTDVLGIDGPWVDRNILKNYIDLSDFKEADIESTIDVHRKFDLAICLEVAEHLPEESSDVIVRNLIGFSDVILFSAATPGQGGQNHINEQWPDYWSKKFNSFGYEMIDIVRPIFWNNKELAWWYKQNMFLVINQNTINTYDHLVKQRKTNIMACVHPDLLDSKVEEINTQKRQIEILQKEIYQLHQGEKSLLSYLKLLLNKIKGSLLPEKTK